MGVSDKEKVITVDELPDDPLAMPPPYWRGSGAVFHVMDCLEAPVSSFKH
jgi:hypothetical protein